MQNLYYVGLDVHKKTVSACVKMPDGTIVSETILSARKSTLTQWAQSFDRPWKGGMEATLFTGWIYDTLLPHASELLVGNPQMMKAIGASKKKNDRMDARKIADMVRCDLMPTCYMPPPEMRELRRILRYRNFLVRQAVKMKNKTSGLLMETGCEYNKKRLHGGIYFNELLSELDEIPESVKGMLRFNHGMVKTFDSWQKRLLAALEKNPLIAERVERLRTIKGVGQVVALTWALEICDPHRFSSIDKAQSYCGLTSAQIESAGKTSRAPISKQRNPNLQCMLVEAAHLAPRWNGPLKELRERELQRGNSNRATLAVARKMVAYLLAVDKSGKPFEERQSNKKEI
jgi:transposase